MNKKAFLATLLCLSMLLGSAIPVLAQTGTTTVSQTATSTTYSTVYSTTTPSTSSGQAATTTATTTPTGTVSTSSPQATTTPITNLQVQLALLQAQVVVLMGRVVANISAQASGTPALATPVRNLQAAWVSYALSLLSNLRARFGL